MTSLLTILALTFFTPPLHRPHHHRCIVNMKLNNKQQEVCARRRLSPFLFRLTHIRLSTAVDATDAAGRAAKGGFAARGGRVTASAETQAKAETC